MNIAFDAAAIEVAKGSGVGNYTLYQFKSMIEMHPEHNFYYFNTINDSALTDIITNKNFHKNFYSTGIDNILRHNGGPYLKLMGSVVKNFIKKNNIDVFYITGPFLDMVYQKEWFDGITVIVTVYDIIPYIMRKQYLSSKGAFQWYMSCVDAIKWTDRQLVISKSVKDDMVKYLDFDSTKIDIIYGGVSDKYHETHISDMDKNKLYNKFKIDSEFMMCSISADWRKNADGIIKAYSKLSKDLINKYQLVIVGRLLTENSDKFKAMIQDLDVTGRVILTDYVTDDEIIQLYNLAKLMVFPSLYEGFGLPVVEAWACGTPVLSSFNSSLGEITSDAGLLFDPYNIKDMTRGLKEALTTADLDKLVEKGKARVKEFSWERVAKLSMDSILCTYNEKILLSMPKNKVACVFLQNEIYSKAWENIINKLDEVFSIDLLKNYDMECIPNDIQKRFKQIDYLYKKKYDNIIYFTTQKVKFDDFEIMNEFKGVWVLVDEIMDTLVNTVLNNKYIKSDLFLAENIKNYFLEQQEEFVEEIALYNTSKKIITADINIKNNFMKIGFNKPIYNINPINDRNLEDFYLYQKDDNLLIKNLCNAILDVKLSDKYDEMIEDILQNQIIARNYSQKEIELLSKTLGFGVSNDFVVNTKTNNKSDLKQKINIDLVTSWNTKCGIAEYTKLYVKYVINKIGFKIFPNISDAKINEDESFVQSRVWEFHGQTNLLAEELLKSDNCIVHIEYTEGFFTTESLANLIKHLHSKKTFIITCHNSKFLMPKNEEELKLLRLAHYVVHQVTDFEILIKNGIDEDNITLIPLGIPILNDKTKNDVRKIIGINDKYPVIGGFGFLLPHKGIYETIKSIEIIKKEYPNVYYIATNAIFDANSFDEKTSRDYLSKCNELIKELKLENNIKLITDFLTPEESLLLLQASDVFVMPYSLTTESASGAIRFCIAAKRPIIVTKQPIFKEFEDCTMQIDTNSKQEIAKAIKNIILDEKYNEYKNLVEIKAYELSWGNISKKYIDLYEKCLKNK